MGEGGGWGLLGEISRWETKKKTFKCKGDLGILTRFMNLDLS